MGVGLAREARARSAGPRAARTGSRPGRRRGSSRPCRGRRWRRCRRWRRRSGWPGMRRSGPTTMRPPRPVGDAEGRRPAGWPARPPPTPACGPASSSPRARRTRVAGHRVDRRRPVRTSTPRRPSVRAGVALRRPGWNGGEQVVGHLDQHDPGPADVERREVLAQHHVEQLGERAGDLDAGRAAADDHEGEGAVVDQRGSASAASKRPRMWLRSRDGVGQRVEREAVLGGAGDRRSTLAVAPGRHDQVVERQRVAVVEQDRAWPSQSTPVTAACRKRDVALALEDAPHRVGDVGRVQTRRWPPGTAAAGTCGSCCRSTMVTSTGASARPRATARPPKPAPTTTTSARPSCSVTGVDRTSGPALPHAVRRSCSAVTGGAGGPGTSGTSTSCGPARPGGACGSACRSGGRAGRGRPYTARPPGGPAMVVRRAAADVGRAAAECAVVEQPAAVAVDRARATGVNGSSPHAKQHLALVDVADAARHPLVEQHLGPIFVRARRRRPCGRTARVDVDVGGAQVGPEVGQGRGWSGGAVAAVELDHRRGEAHRHPAARPRPRPAPGAAGFRQRSPVR